MKMQRGPAVSRSAGQVHGVSSFLRVPECARVSRRFMDANRSEAGASREEVWLHTDFLACEQYDQVGGYVLPEPRENKCALAIRSRL